ncbi:MAG: hypothetical protein GX961_11605 [Firmicutes bacterium]|nr:hypothetical protein [Bacillota bacterium]
MYKYIGKEFDRRFLVVSKEVGCSNCKNLESFLQYGLDGKYDDQITNITLESNEEDYNAVVKETGAMSVPIIVDLETGKFISGFNPPEVVELLNG